VVALARRRRGAGAPVCGRIVVRDGRSRKNSSPPPRKARRPGARSEVAGAGRSRAVPPARLLDVPPRRPWLVAQRDRRRGAQRRLAGRRAGRGFPAVSLRGVGLLVGRALPVPGGMGLSWPRWPPPGRPAAARDRLLRLHAAACLERGARGPALP